MKRKLYTDYRPSCFRTGNWFVGRRLERCQLPSHKGQITRHCQSHTNIKQTASLTRLPFNHELFTQTIKLVRVRLWRARLS